MPQPRVPLKHTCWAHGSSQRRNLPAESKGRSSARRYLTPADGNGCGSPPLRAGAGPERLNQGMNALTAVGIAELQKAI